ncbi:MAG TPA: glycosyltransferase family 4 protein [Rhodopila sp.]|nr:glycosyltransferase family 4 protein [Rhodopila sp.]
MHGLATDPVSSGKALGAVDPDLWRCVTERYPGAIVARLPHFTACGDSTAAFVRLARAVRTTPAVLFPAVTLTALEGFFRLRLIQILRGQAALDAVSIVELTDGADAFPLGGFADRFRSGWPFARCLFVVKPGPDAGLAAARLRDRLGLPVGVPTPGLPEAELVPNHPADPKIALQLQPIWGRSGSTTVFENQVEALVRAGYFTIRVFQDPRMRRGPTLDARLSHIVPESQVHAGAHMNLAAVPLGPYLPNHDLDARQSWAASLAKTTQCRIDDRLTRKAAARAEVVMANHIETVGMALTIAPRARLILEAHDDRASAAGQAARMEGLPPEEVEAAIDAAASVQAKILRLPDLAIHVSTTEHRRLGPLSERAATVVPRVYPAAVPDHPAPRFDILLVGDANPFNIASLKWFLDTAWRPFLAPADTRVALAGRVADHVDRSAYAHPDLHFIGFVDDLEALRAGCRLTVIPHRHGTGISVALLTTLAAGHPVVTTQVALRGLDSAVVAGLPAHDDPAALAHDILSLLGDPALLARRREAVRAAQGRISQSADHASLIAGLPPPDAEVTARRLAQWRMLTAPAERPVPEPFLFTFENELAISQERAVGTVLLRGWQQPEPWGCWTDGATATFAVRLAEPCEAPLRLELDLSLTPLHSGLTLAIDGAALPKIVPTPGVNGWDIPIKRTRGKTGFRVTLTADASFRPSQDGTSVDDRILGVGVSAIRVRPRPQMPDVLQERLRLCRGQPLSGILAEGWHTPEEWGCWTAGTDAVMRLAFDEPLSGLLRLDLDIAPSPIGGALAVTVEGHAMPAVVPVAGTNTWLLPLSATNERRELRIHLRVPAAVRPSDLGQTDDRVLGIGVRSVGITPVEGGICTVGQMLSLRNDQSLPHVLDRGWHKQEPWGCWTSAPNASLRLICKEPLGDFHRLDLDVQRTPVTTDLTLTVNGITLPPTRVKPGVNSWLLPPGCVAGHEQVDIGLLVPETYCPAASGTSTDDRVLGIGVKAIGLFPAPETPPWPLGDVLPVNATAGWRGIHAAGWHKLEPWGVWSDQVEAFLRFRFDAPLHGQLMLVLNPAAPPRPQRLTLVVDDTALAPVRSETGQNRWALPPDCTEGKSSLTIRLRVDAVVRPMDIGPSADDRALGVGLRGIGFLAIG